MIKGYGSSTYEFISFIIGQLHRNRFMTCTEIFTFLICMSSILILSYDYDVPCICLLRKHTGRLILVVIDN